MPDRERDQQDSFQWASKDSSAGAVAIAQLYAQELKLVFVSLTEQPSSKKLHRFRVLVRRLRTTLKLYQSISVNPKRCRGLRKRLSQLGKLSNNARDLEVAQKLLKKLAQSETESLIERRLRKKLLRNFADLQALEEERIRQQLIGGSSRVVSELEAQLTKLFQTRAITSNQARKAQQLPFKKLVAKIDGRLRKKLQRSLRTLNEDMNITASHSTRLIAKKLRYLLAPFAPSSVTLAKRVASLTELQDDLGEICDLNLLKGFIPKRFSVGTSSAEEVTSRADESAVLANLLSQVRIRELKAYKRLKRKWLSKEARRRL